ncbi:MAG: hypothetical protein R3C03_04610 [Pirellulaceae bacterium]
MAQESTLRKTSTNLKRFDIPFSISDPADNFIEVQLYVSRNQGQSWQFYGRESTVSKSFTFSANSDGKYWFALRTLDRDRRLHPDTEMKPELEVVVDSVDPEVNLQVRTDNAGRIVCRWDAQDPNLSVANTQLAFRPLLAIDDRDNVWIPVPYKPVTEAINGGFTDQYAWWPETSAREVLVQLTIVDTAGNRAIEERQLIVPRMANLSTNRSMVTTGSNPVPKASAPSQSEAPSGSNSQAQEDSQAETYGKLVDAYRPKIPDTNQSQPNQADKSANKRIVWGGNRSSNSGIAENSSTAQAMRPDERPVIPVAPASAKPDQPQAPSSSSLEAIKRSATPSSELSPLAPILKPNNQAADELPAKQTAYQHASDQIPDTGEQNEKSVVETSTRTPLERIDSINTRRFRMGYSLDRLTPGDVAKVVLWITNDDGRTWSAYGEDPDNQSPFPVELPGPGTYGFKVVFHTTDGLQGRAPTRGETPDYWVRVDLEHPQARLTAAPYGEGSETGSLVIHWQASDELLSRRCVTLSYSSFANGPWTIIETGLENSGRYAWQVGKEVPEQVFLQLEVADAAGNISRNQTNDLVDLSGLVPKARITGVEPVK